jgi:hypothetical protein
VFHGAPFNEIGVAKFFAAFREIFSKQHSSWLARRNHISLFLFHFDVTHYSFVSDSKEYPNEYLQGKYITYYT